MSRVVCEKEHRRGPGKEDPGVSNEWKVVMEGEKCEEMMCRLGKERNKNERKGRGEERRERRGRKRERGREQRMRPSEKNCASAIGCGRGRILFSFLFLLSPLSPEPSGVRAKTAS